ncbi:hypothetical protein ACOSQ4_017163 [Xanthoceras sorbifolium]
MDEVRVPCMNGGDEATSYANNSFLQKTVILKVKPVLEETIKDMLMITCFPASFKVADLGCSSGPNTLLVISEILDTVHAICQQFNQKSLEIQVFLNDLPENDFNSVFKSLPAFNQRLKKDKGDQFGPCFVSGVPCSFYERLFPSRSIHLIHSSSSVHWLSKVPENLGSNKKNIYIAKSSPPSAYKAYLEQFQRDFSTFLSLRSEEIIVGGRMVLTFVGRSIPDPSSKDCCYLWELLAKSFLELVDEGLVEAAKVDSFDVPCYYPCEEEVRDIVEKEGSFDLNKLEIFEVNWDPSDDPSNNEFVFNKYRSGKNVANCVCKPCGSASGCGEDKDHQYSCLHDKNIIEDLMINIFGYPFYLWPCVINDTIYVHSTKRRKNKTIPRDKCFTKLLSISKSKLSTRRSRRHKNLPDRSSNEPLRADGSLLLGSELTHRVQAESKPSSSRVSRVGGDEATSYANNSLLQKTVILKARPVLEETIKDMLMTTCFPASFKVADLGCSSGPNTLLVMSEILDTIHTMCNNLIKNHLKFNVFKSLPAFNQTLKKDKGDQFGPCFVSGVPCSFYERLFPSRSIHLIHSYYSVHWLSNNMYIAKSSPPSVYKAYLEQFQRDFSTFLSLRSEEIIVGERMVLTFVGRSIPDPSSKDCFQLWELLAKSFLELVDEGLVEAAKVDSFDVPCYYPCKEEVRDIVEKEGSFNLNKLEIFAVNWDPSDDPNNKEFVFNKNRSGKNVANCARAGTEPMLLPCHFGKSIIDTLFNRYANHVAQHLAVEKTKFINIVVSMTKI